jgi:hypothetical protein
MWNISKGCVFGCYTEIVQVYANKKGSLLLVVESLETKRAEYPLPYNLVCKVSSLLHGDGTDDRVESVSEDDIDTG